MTRLQEDQVAAAHFLTGSNHNIVNNNSNNIIEEISRVRISYLDTTLS